MPEIGLGGIFRRTPREATNLMIQRKTQKIVFNRERRSKRLWMPLLRILLVASVSLIAAAQQNPQQNQRSSNKVSDELAEKHDRAKAAGVLANEMVDVIVQFKQTPGSHHFDKVKG